MSAYDGQVIRVDKDRDRQILAHTIVVGGFSSHCGNCGGNYLNSPATECQECHTTFWYAAFTKMSGSLESDAGYVRNVTNLPFIGHADGSNSLSGSLILI